MRAPGATSPAPAVVGAAARAGTPPTVLKSGDGGVVDRRDPLDAPSIVDLRMLEKAAEQVFAGRCRRQRHDMLRAAHRSIELPGAARGTETPRRSPVRHLSVTSHAYMCYVTCLYVLRHMLICVTSHAYIIALIVFRVDTVRVRQRFHGVATENLPTYLSWRRTLEAMPADGGPAPWIAATTTGICSAERPRLAALPPRRRAGLARPPRRPFKDSSMNVSSASTMPERLLGLSRLRAARNRCRHRKAVLGWIWQRSAALARLSPSIRARA